MLVNAQFPIDLLTLAKKILKKNLKDFKNLKIRRSWLVLLGTRLSKQDNVGDEWVNLLKKMTNFIRFYIYRGKPRRYMSVIN